jgi:ubiquinone/menaquinone biosynthesis C-methylase UbiE
MLDLTRSPAQHLSRDVTLRQGTAHALPFADASFKPATSTSNSSNASTSA